MKSIEYISFFYTIVNIDNKSTSIFTEIDWQQQFYPLRTETFTFLLCFRIAGKCAVNYCVTVNLQHIAGYSFSVNSVYPGNNTLLLKGCNQARHCKTYTLQNAALISL